MSLWIKASAKCPECKRSINLVTFSMLMPPPFPVQEREIDHAAGSHGVAGIFVKYDTSALMVTVREQHMPLGQFLVRLCGIVGGVFSTTGL